MWNLQQIPQPNVGSGPDHMHVGSVLKPTLHAILAVKCTTCCAAVHGDGVKAALGRLIVQLVPQEQLGQADGIDRAAL
jgi:hypothetical protein